MVHSVSKEDDMLNLLIGILLGAVGATVVWYFVWRNNKKKFQDSLVAMGEFRSIKDVRNHIDELIK